MFKNAKVGDKVWCVLNGWGVIVAIEEHAVYQIEVSFDDNTTPCEEYTLEGFMLDAHNSPSLFWNEFEIPESAYAKPCPFKVNDVVTVFGDVEIKNGTFPYPARVTDICDGVNVITPNNPVSSVWKYIVPFNSNHIARQISPEMFANAYVNEVK